MRGHGPLRRFPLAGMAVAGVVVGHWLAYAFALPDQHMRAAVLVATGHSYWLLAIKTAAVMGPTALGAVVLRHVRGALRGHGAGADQLAPLVLRLGSLQILAFKAMEITERLAAGAPVGAMFTHHLFLAGLAAQVVVAFAGAVLLLWFGRVSARVCRAIRTLTFSAPAHAGARPDSPPVRPVAALAGAAGVRGPPRG